MIKILKDKEFKIINYQDGIYSSLSAIGLIVIIILNVVSKILTLGPFLSRLNFAILLITIILALIIVQFFNKRSLDSLENAELMIKYIQQIILIFLILFLFSSYSYKMKPERSMLLTSYLLALFIISIIYLILIIISVIQKSFININSILSDTEIKLEYSTRFLLSSKKWEKILLKENAIEFIFLKKRINLVHMKPQDMKYEDIQYFLNISGKNKLNYFLILAKTKENDPTKKYHFIAKINNREELKMVVDSAKSINLPINVLKIN